MRKNKVFILLISLLFLGCDMSEINRRQEELNNSDIPVMHAVRSPNGKAQLDYWTVIIDNHQYKVFYLPNADYMILHDPDCECHKRVEKEEEKEENGSNLFNSNINNNLFSF